MRKEFADQMSKLGKDKKHIFLTGDLGFMALENVRDIFGQRFINCGVSEQNMVGVAAGLAKSGFTVFVYSIAPFIYARPYEHIRNDIVFSNLPVCLVGNGGGYGYGYMGPTHHALEDCAALSALGMNVIVPVFDKDIAKVTNNISSPTYLRLGLETLPEGKDIPQYDSWRLLEKGNNGVVVGLGPIAGLIWETILEIPVNMRPSLWAVSDFDLNGAPDEFYRQVGNQNLYIFEEHVVNGGLGMHISYMLNTRGINLLSLTHKYAFGYPKDTFGSQNYHRKQSGLDKETVLKFFLEGK